MPPVHVAQVNFHPLPSGRSLADMMTAWPSMVDIAQAPASAGVRVTVVQAAEAGERWRRDGVDYVAVDVRDLPPHERTATMARAIDDCHADVIHVHGIGFARDAHALSRCLPRRPMLLQDHADRAPRWWRRHRWRTWLGAAHGVAFTAPELARPFVAADLLDLSTRVFAIPESTSRFTPGGRAAAWAQTGLYGDPCVLWVGHLAPGKDPLTVLDGIALAASRLPGLQLWCAFGSAPLFDDVRRRIDGDTRLAGRVHLLGKVPHEGVQSLMRAADVFVSGSRAESCGYALLEAMACDVTPVVTNIPSFRAMLGDVGRLWPCGDAQALAEALVHVIARRTPSGQVRARFDQALSLEAIGRLWREAYVQLLNMPGKRAP